MPEFFIYYMKNCEQGGRGFFFIENVKQNVHLLGSLDLSVERSDVCHL